MTDFDQTKYAGQWYTIEMDKRNRYSRGGTDCVTKEFQMNKDGNCDLYFRGKYQNWGYRGVNGTLYECDTGLCQATMGYSNHRSDFRIFYTNYEDFEISYRCSERNGKKEESYSISSRHQTMSPEQYKMVKEMVADKLPFFIDYINDEDNIYRPVQGGKCEYDWQLTPAIQPLFKFLN